MTNKEDFVTVINPSNGKTKQISKAELEKTKELVILESTNGDVFATTREEYNKLGDKMRGCFIVFASFFILLMAGGITLISIDQYEKNKKHINVIANINNKDKQITITDINTGKNRTVDYREYNKKTENLTFQNMVNHSNIGDTVAFVSPNYDKKGFFELKTKYQNRLILNKDSVLTRIKAEQLKLR